MEEYYRGKIQTFLDNIVGANNSTVRVTAMLQFNRVEKAKETYSPQPQQPAVKTEDISTEGVDPLNLDVLMSNSDAPPAPPVLKQKKAVNYELNKEMEKTVITPGDIKGVTVAVVLNGKYEEKFLSDLKQSISAATGISVKSGDIIDIKAMEFRQSITEEEKAKIEEMAERNFYLSALKDYLPAVALIIIGAFFAVNLGKGLSNFSAAVHVSHGENGGNGNGHGKNMKAEEILKMARENPKEAAKVIKSWIS